MKKILIIALIFVGLTQCKKEEVVATTLEFNNANVAGNYRITGSTITASGIEQDVFASSFPACNKDDNHTFSVAGVYTNSDIGVLCTPPTPSVTGPYTVTNTATAKTMSFGGKDYTVVSFTALNLVLSSPTTITIGGSSIAAVAKLTLTRQ